MNVDHDENPRKAAAQALAAQGFHVLPVKAGEKRPDPLLAPDGFKNCTTDAETVGGWFDVKSKLNVGIACGAEYGLLVVDVDIKGAVDGRKALSDLWLDQPTLTADTPSGGFHMYYRHPGTALKAKLPGIDLKGADGGGYVLAPPSILPNGAYTWRDPEIPIAPFPPYLLDELRADQPPRANGAAKATGPAATLVVSEGRRHARLVELGAIYRGKGLASDEIETLLWEHAARYFDPPFSRDNAEHEREIEAVVRWYGGKAASADDVPQLLVIDSTDLRARAAAVPDRALIDPLLPEAGNLMIYGPSGHGKSHLALSIALALARGMPLLDWTVPSVVPVLFCDGEMPLPELVARLNQYLGGASPPATLWWAAARAQPGDMPDLADPAAQGHYLAAIESCNARAVVFDNLSCLRTTTADSPENSVEAWHPIAAFLRRLNGIGVATVTVHHAAKSGSQRGSSMHVAVMDTVLRVAAPGEGQGDPTAELDVEIVAEKHRRFGGEATLPIRARVIQDCDGLATWHLAAQDPLVEDVVRLRKAGQSIRQIAQSLKRSKAGIEKALMRAKARGLLPLGGVE